MPLRSRHLNSGEGPIVQPEEVFPSGAGEQRFALLDVRAPVEVRRGGLPGSHNLPILDDEERHLVGIEYKRSGQDAAVALGYRLTAAKMPERIEQWRLVATRGPTAVSCWRGGMRSDLTQQFLAPPLLPRVAGGYKALRSHLVSNLLTSLERKRVIVLSGMTGTGKTDLLESLAPDAKLLALDLEALACHRGSSFGWRGTQPAQQTFENELAARVVLDSSGVVLVEDESRRVGGLHLPEPLYARVARGPVLVLEAPWEERIERIHRQYIIEPIERLGSEKALADLKAATTRLRRRLGGGLVDRLIEVLDDVAAADRWRDQEALEPFIGPLLQEYYDPLYRRAADKMARPVLAGGTKEDLFRWIAHEL